jgi:flavin-dependent dehydrogenase
VCWQLAHWGLLERVIASGCPPVRTIVTDPGDFVLTATMPAIAGLAEMYAPRRIVLDQILIDAAVAAGAELRDGVVVPELVWDGDRVAGIRARGRSGAVHEERARIVGGADGMRSMVARTVKAEAYDEVPTRACWYYAYWSGLGLEEFHVRTRPGHFVLAFPTNADLACMLIGWPVGDFHTVRADVDGHVLATLEAAAPDLASACRARTAKSDTSAL